jgi:hypothetical protein
LIIYPDSSMFTSQSFIVIIIIIILLQLRERKVKPLSLMIMPIFMFIVTWFLIQGVIFTSLLNFVLISGSFILGVLIGFFVASFIKVKVDDKGNVMMRGSVIAVAIWILVILIKIYGEQTLGSLQYFDLSVLTSMFLMITLGTMISRRAFIYRKYRQHKLIYNENNKDLKD